VSAHLYLSWGIATTSAPLSTPRSVERIVENRIVSQIKPSLGPSTELGQHWREEVTAAARWAGVPVPLWVEKVGT
jgi:hypothetical protein